MPKPTRNAFRQEADQAASRLPLFPHATGRWAKKVWQLHYFGKVADDPRGKPRSISGWNKSDLLAAVTPRERREGEDARTTRLAQAAPTGRTAIRRYVRMTP